ncbi:hypothetical protein DF020_27440 [Burkholderia cenocepacia]|nr:hypothetical protein DF020_27440 [Burkholderia cenocepacia]
MGGALNDARHRAKNTVATRHRRIVSRAGIHSPGARVVARPTPCSRPPHGAGTNGPRIMRLGSRGRVDTRGYPLVIK